MSIWFFFGFGFAVATACTNHFNCTSERCPSVCDRISIAFALNTLTQVVVIVVSAIHLDGRAACAAVGTA